MNNKRNLLLYPVPKKVVYGKGKLKYTEDVHIEYRQSMEDEEYVIVIDCDGVCIKCKDNEALYRARTTLKQIVLQSCEELPYLEIYDKPDFKERGVMIDISRCRVQTLDTLKHIVDILSDLKINQLQLYIEGFSYAYEKYPQVWENITPITGEEIKKLDKYCKEKYIELVPNQNSYGHMHPWLQREEFKHLAMCPDGFDFELFGGHVDFGWSLDLEDEKALEFLFGLYDDLLSSFSSKKFNVCCDETLDLGQGKSKESCDNYGKGKVYLDGLMKIYENLKTRGLTMMFWGDIILNHPECAKMLPKDIIALNWGYNSDQVKEESCKCFMEAEVPYYVCPGTSAWNSVWGVTDKMISNIKTSVYNGLKYGAVGVINTDWGDLWHLNHLPVSYAGYCYGAAMAWNACDEEEKLLPEYINKFILKDKNNIMGKLLLDMGSYHKLETVDCMSKYGRTHLAHILCGSLDETGTAGDVKEETLHNMEAYIDEIVDRVSKADMKCKDSDIVAYEVEAGALILKYACQLGLYKIGAYKNGSREYHLEKLKELQEKMLEMHKVAWLSRNKPSRLQEGIDALTKL